MGIDGLHNLLKPCLQPYSLFQLQGKIAVIDAMCFLYKGCYPVAYQLNNNIETKSFMLILLRLVRMIKQNRIKPIVIFDGRSIKAKDLTIAKRNEVKMKNLETAIKQQNEGSHAEAQKSFMKCLFVNKEMIYDTIDVLRANNIDYLISPYEADAQMAFMVRQQQADFAISEDSDLVCFGCPRIAFKLKMDGSCEYFDDALYQTSEQRKALKSEPLRCFLSLPYEIRTMVCIMAGCDYLPNIQGIGIKISCYLFYSQRDFKLVMKKLRSESKTKDNIPESYDIFFEKVTLVFKYQRIFNQETNQLETLNPLPLGFNSDDQGLIGEEISHFQEVVSGKRDIYSLKVRQQKQIDMKTYFASEKNWKPAYSQKPKEVLNQEQKERKRFENNKIAEAAAAIRNTWKKNDVNPLKDDFINIDNENNPENNSLIKPNVDEDYNEDYLLSLLENIQDEQEMDSEEQDAEQPIGIESTSSNKISEVPLSEEQQLKATQYLEYLCNSFVKEYLQISSKSYASSSRSQIVVTRNNIDQTDQKTNQEQNERLQQVQTIQGKETSKPIIVKSNPFAIKQTKSSQIQSTFDQPDSLEDLSNDKNNNTLIMLPEKKKSILDLPEQNRKVIIPIDSQTPKKQKLILTDFFVSNKKRKEIKFI